MQSIGTERAPVFIPGSCLHRRTARARELLFRQPYAALQEWTISGMNTLAIETRAKPGSTCARAPFTERGALRLFVRREGFLANCRDSLAALVERRPKAPRYAIYFLRSTNISRVRFAGRSLGLSFVLHCAFLALVLYLPQAIPAAPSMVEAAPNHWQKIYYRVPVLDSSKLPRIVPKGRGGRPGAGSLPARLPALGATARRPNITIVSSPAHPDNFRQTIFQPTAPPDLKITTDQKLPNIVMGQALQQLKAPLAPNNARPNQLNRQLSRVDAPSLADNTSKQAPMMAFLKTSNAHPELAIPVSGGGAPIQRASGGSSSASAGNSTDAAGLMLLGVDPASADTQFSLPAGNRWGQFSIAPPSAPEGSPGGDPRGEGSVGKGAGTSGGDASTGPGPGSSGGGGGNSGAEGAVSISGPAAGGEGGALDPTLPISMVYPVAAPPLNVRRNTLIISSGPMGGGGLNVYGALKCGKVYSVFLPMPGRNWSMQYCDNQPAPASVSAGGYTTVLHLDNPLLPPDVDMTHRFDFKRLPVPVEKAQRSIILKGTIGTDGTVRDLVVFQGVQPKMDEAARLAFGKWRFKPAMRNHKPVEVQILVGIPPERGEDRIHR